MKNQITKNDSTQEQVVAKVTKRMSLYDKMKLEIAKEFNVELGPNASPVDNGRVGGEITRRLVAEAKQRMIEIEVDE